MNVGSFFRTGDAFAIEKIYLTGYTPRAPHKEMFKTAIGASETVAWEHHQEGVPLIRSLKSKGRYRVGIAQPTDSDLLPTVTKPSRPSAAAASDQDPSI